MLFALNGKNCGVKFKLATEKVNSKWDKFDDLIFRYDEGNGKIKYSFLQAKHKYSGDEKIKIDDLKSNRDGNDYSLQTYFKSYLIYDLQYKDGDLKDFIICSNVGIDFEPIQDQNKQRWKGYFEEKTETDPILNLGGTIYQFKKSKIEEIIEELKPIFKNALLPKPQKENTKEPEKNEFLDYLSELAGVQVSLDDCIDKIGEFLDKLVFAIKQPSGEKLEKIIADKMGNQFNLINNITYYQFYSFMSKWMQDYKTADKNKKKEKDENKGYYLTQDDLEIFFAEAKEKIATLGMISSSLLYKGKIKHYGIEFKDNIKEFQEIRNFLNDKEKQILIMYHRKALLSGIKVCQVLESSYKDSYIFSDLETLSILKSSVGDPITTFKRLDHNLLIVEDDSKKQEDMLNDFINVLSDHPKKKLILITTKGEKDEQLFIDKEIKCSELEDLSNKLTDLTDKCQNSLLNKAGTVIFQGKELTVSSIIEEKNKYLISGEVLRMLINNEKIKIGREIDHHNYNEINEYYIERKFYRTTEDDENETSQDLIRSDDIPINATSESNLTIQSRDNILVERIKTDEDDVDIIDYVHGLPKNLENLSSFLITKTYRSFTRSINQSIPQDSINDKEVIIVSEPGMGKSILLTRIALQKKETDPSILVLNIKLVDYSSELNELKTDNKNKALIKFLYKTFLKKYTELTETFLNSIKITIKGPRICIKDNEKNKIIINEKSKIDDVSWLEVQLFNEFYNNGKVMFFFDGFDEICPHYKVEVIKLLKVLKQSRSTIWITSRPYNINKELENELGVISYDLVGLSQDEQQNYLKKFWSVDNERSDIFVKGLLKHFAKSTKDVKGNFLGIPLHLYMLAVVYKNEFKVWNRSGKKIFSISGGNKEQLYSLIYVYKEFIRIKFHEILIEEKMPSLNSPRPKEMETAEGKYVSLLKDHKKLAAYTLLNDSDVKLFLSEEELNEIKSTMIEYIKVGKEYNGFISHVSDNKPVFVHRTFAEYFLSQLIYDKLKTDNKVLEFLLKRILVKLEYRFICRFLNCLFADYEVDNKKSEIIKKALTDIVYDLDPGSSFPRNTPLIVASFEGLEEIVKFLLKNQPTDKLRNLKDVCFKNVLIKGVGYSPFYYQHVEFCSKTIMDKKFINVRRSSYNALDWAVLWKHLGVMRMLLENGACITVNSVFTACRLDYFNKQVFEVLLKYINSDEHRGWFISALSYQSEEMITTYNKESIELLEMLIEKFHDVNIQDKNGNTLLHIVAMFVKNNIPDSVFKCFDNKSQLRIESFISKLQRKLAELCSSQTEQIVKFETVPNWVRTVKLLLEKGADENILNNNGERPIDFLAGERKGLVPLDYTQQPASPSFGLWFYDTIFPYIKLLFVFMLVVFIYILIHILIYRPVFWFHLKK